MAQSNSQGRNNTVVSRASYLLALFRAHMQRRSLPASFDSIASDVEDYLGFLNRQRGRDGPSPRILEIGVGQRPYRLMAMQSLGMNAVGVDLDRPVVRPSLADYWRVARSNGLVRAAKTMVRTLVFDAPDYAAFRDMLASRFKVALRYDDSKVHVGNAGRAETWRVLGGPFDIIYSDDVFEHIPPDDLDVAVAQMAANIASDGVAIITPMVFSGICGGHELEWYPATIDQPVARAYPAWGHLTGETPPADTYLNRLTRADYRALLSRHFIIVREVEKQGPDLGRQHLTDERRSRLKDFSDDELFSNAVRFYLAPKPFDTGGGRVGTNGVAP